MSTSKGSILITGANGGISVGFVEELLKTSYSITHHSIYVVRDPAKASALKATLEKAPRDHHHQILALDLDSLASVRAVAAAVNKQVADGSLAPIQALVLNAGVQDLKGESSTKDGMERVFQVNYLCNFLLVLLLLQSMDKEHGRIIFMGSTSTKLTWGPNAGNFTSEKQIGTLITTPENMSKGIEEHPDGHPYKTGMRRYSMSKLLCMEWMYELQRRLDADPELSNISILGLDPGWVGATGIVRSQPLAGKIVMGIVGLLAVVLALFYTNPLFRTPANNGKDMLRVCFDREAFGEYPKAVYVNGSILDVTPEYANDEAKQRELWEGSVKFAKIKDGDTVLKNWR